MEPKTLEGIWVCAPSSDPGRRRGPFGTKPEVSLFRTPHLATLQQSAGPGAAWGQILKREPDHLSQKQLAMKSANAQRLAHQGKPVSQAR
ncbi:hypothetical protein DBR06_SOUSAS9110027, partial [Sousa chinensis]